MLHITVVPLLIFLSLFFPEKSQAIVLLPAVILIPLAKLLAIIVASLSVPIASIGWYLAKISRNSGLAKKVVFTLIIVTTLISAIVLKITNPENPWL